MMRFLFFVIFIFPFWCASQVVVTKGVVGGKVVSIISTSDSLVPNSIDSTSDIFEQNASSNQVFFVSNTSQNGTFSKCNTCTTVDTGVVVQSLNSIKFKRNGVVFSDPLWWGGVNGNLSLLFPSYTYNQLKAIRRKNYAAFKSAATYAASNSVPVQMPEYYEIDFIGSESFLIPAGKTLELNGNNSFLKLYPKVQAQGRGTRYIVRGADATEVCFKASGLNVQGRDNANKYEGYGAILKYSGTNNLIKIKSTVSTRPGFWSELNGKTIFYARSQTSGSWSGTVASHDSIAKTITLTASLDAAVPNADSGAYTNIFFFWDEDESQGNIDNYSKSYLNGTGSAMFDYFVSGNNSGGTNSINTPWIIADSKITKLDVCIGRSNFFTDLICRNLYIQSYQVAVSDFAGLLTFYNASSGKLIVDNCEFVSCGLYHDGGDTESGPDGSGIYSSPTKNSYLSNCRFHNNNASPVRFFSGSGNKAQYTHPAATSIWENCQFWSNGEPARISPDVTTEISGCKWIYDSGVILSNTSLISNSTIRGTQISQPGDTNEPSLDSSNVITITFQNCIFRDNSKVQLGFVDNTDRVTYNFNNCEWYISNANMNDHIESPYDGAYVNIVNSKIYLTGISTSFPYFLNSSSKFFIDNLQVVAAKPSSSGLSFFSISASDSMSIDIFRSKLIWNTILPFQRAGPFSWQVRLYESEVNVNSAWDARFLVKSFKKGKRKASYSGNSLKVYSDSDTYECNGTTISSISPQNLGATHTVDGTNIYLHAASGFSINRYDSTTNTSSNILGSSTISVQKGEVKHLRSVRAPLGVGIVRDSITVGTGDGVQTTFTITTNGELTNSRIPGTITVVAGSVSGVDDFSGRIFGTGILSSGIEYFYPYFRIIFSTAPANGVPVKLYYYRYTTTHQKGYWVVLN